MGHLLYTEGNRKNCYFLRKRNCLFLSPFAGIICYEGAVSRGKGLGCGSTSRNTVNWHSPELKE